MFKSLILGLGLAMSFNAYALKVDSGTAAKDFRVNGKTVTPIEAFNHASKGDKVFICKPKEVKKGKTYITDNGASVTAGVLECTEQELVINAKTGVPKWKAKK